MTSSPRSVILAALLTMLTLAACGDDDSGGGGSGSPETEEGAAASAREFAEAMLAGESTYGFLTSDCQAQFSADEWDAQMELAFSMIESFGEVSFDELTVGEVTTVEFDGDSAMVTIELLGPDGQPFDDGGDPSPLVYEDGGWRIPECETFGDLSDSTDDETGDDDTTDDSTFDGELRPADEVAEERTREETVDGVLGEAVQVGGLDVVISAIEYDSEEDDLLRVEVRVENRTSEDESSPDVAVVCADGERGTARFTSDDGMYEPYTDLPSGSFEEGTSLVRIPERCADPLVRVEVLAFDTQAADWELPAR